MLSLVEITGYEALHRPVVALTGLLRGVALQLDVGLRVAAAAEGAQIRRVEHQPSLLGGGGSALHRSNVVHLLGYSHPPLLLAALAAGILGQHPRAQIAPLARMYHLVIRF